MGKMLLKGFGAIVAVVFLLVSVAGCATESEGEDIPDEVLEVAEGLFETLSFMLQEYPATHPRTGLTITGDSTHRVMTASNYSPDYGLYVNGSAEMWLLSASPYEIRVEVGYVISGQLDATVTMSGTAKWKTGDNPVDDEPSSFSGNFTFNGDSYKNSDILDAL